MFSKKLTTLLQTLSDGKFHSGSALGAALHITRSAIWKLIKQLANYGIEIETKTKLGYRIPQGGLELLDKNVIWQFIAPDNRKHLSGNDSIAIFDCIPSTNTYLMEQLQYPTATKRANLDQSKTRLCLAESQSGGKGRRGHEWISPYGRNIYLSLLWRFTKDPLELSGLSLAVAVAVVEALRFYYYDNLNLADTYSTIDTQGNLGVKWPNDVLWRGRKLAGILIELAGEAHDIYGAVIGVGVNVNMPQQAGKKITQPWCDITQIIRDTATEKEKLLMPTQPLQPTIPSSQQSSPLLTRPQRNKLTGILIDQLLTAARTYQERGLTPFLERWRELDVAYGKPVTIITPTQNKINGIARGIDERGRFLLENPQDGAITPYISGEVSLRLSKL
jgi:BirA family transcriptional regulator, biotin operon repressor / biotin---[acetyl-CoA-carboxylase] ligase